MAIKPYDVIQRSVRGALVDLMEQYIDGCLRDPDLHAHSWRKSPVEWLGQSINIYRVDLDPFFEKAGLSWKQAFIEDIQFRIDTITAIRMIYRSVGWVDPRIEPKGVTTDQLFRSFDFVVELQ